MKRDLIEVFNLFIHNVEDDIFNLNKTAFSIINRIIKLFIFPFKIIAFGYNIFFKSAMIFSLLYFIFILCSGVVKNILFLDNIIYTNFFIILPFLATFLVLFIPPSFYNLNKKDKKINLIIQQLHKYSLSNKASINFVTNELSRRKNIVHKRISYLKWFIASIWAFIIYTFSKFDSVNNNYEFMLFFRNIEFISLFLLIFVILVFSYEAGINRFFYIFDVAIDEQSYQLTIKNKYIRIIKNVSESY